MVLLFLIFLHFIVTRFHTISSQEITISSSSFSDLWNTQCNTPSKMNLSAPIKFDKLELPTNSGKQDEE